MTKEITKPKAAKTIVVCIAGVDFTFIPTVQDANNYMNELMPNNKVVPAYNYLSRTVEQGQRDELCELLDTVPGLVTELHAKVSEEAKGGVTITIKN